MSLPPLQLGVSIQTLDGQTIRLDSAATRGSQRPAAIQFGTRLMEGFAAASCQVSASEDWQSLDGATLRIVGADGATAYEGRVAGGMESLDSVGDLTTISAGSWMAHAKDQPLPPYLFVDRSLDRWSSASAERRARTISPDGRTPVECQIADGRVLLSLPPAPLSLPPCVEGFYTAPAGTAIGRIQGRAERSAWMWPIPADFILAIYSATTPDFATGVQGTGNLMDASPQVRTFTPTNSPRYGLLSLVNNTLTYGSTPPYVNDADRTVTWTQVVVHGATGLPIATNGNLRVSDIIRYTAAQVAPLLDLSMLADSDAATVDHCVSDEGGSAYDLWLALNRFEFRNLAVWENRCLTYEPLPAGEAASPSWVVRSADTGVNVRLSGEQTQASGVIVRYVDAATMRAEVLTPSSQPSLSAESGGIEQQLSVGLPEPTTMAQALTYGERLLALYNNQRQPARLTVTGYVRGAGGEIAQSWKVRAGDYILISDEPDAVPRLVTETSYSAAGNILTATLDSQPQDVDALLAQAMRG